MPEFQQMFLFWRMEDLLQMSPVFWLNGLFVNGVTEFLSEHSVLQEGHCLLWWCITVSVCGGLFINCTGFLF